ncbi:MAG: ArsR family transcriptional regulator, partial [Ornithinimicrobium sp.]
QPTVSHHLRKLREAGLIVGERRGSWVYYRAVPAALGAVREFAQDHSLSDAAP